MARFFFGFTADTFITTFEWNSRSASRLLIAEESVVKHNVLNYPVVNGGSGKRNELGVPIFPKNIPLSHGEPVGAT